MAISIFNIIGILLLIGGITMSAKGVYKAIKSKYTDWDAAILCWCAVPVIYIGTLMSIIKWL